MKISKNKNGKAKKMERAIKKIKKPKGRKVAHMKANSKKVRSKISKGKKITKLVQF